MIAPAVNSDVVSWSGHIVVLPIVLPIAVAGILFLLDERRRRLKAGLTLATMLALLGVAVFLVMRVDEAPPSIVSGTGRLPTASCWWPTGSRR